MTHRQSVSSSVHSTQCLPLCFTVAFCKAEALTPWMGQFIHSLPQFLFPFLPSIQNQHAPPQKGNCGWRNCTMLGGPAMLQWHKVFWSTRWPLTKPRNANQSVMRKKKKIFLHDPQGWWVQQNDFIVNQLGADATDLDCAKNGAILVTQEWQCVAVVRPQTEVAGPTVDRSMQRHPDWLAHFQSDCTIQLKTNDKQTSHLPRNVQTTDRPLQWLAQQPRWLTLSFQSICHQSQCSGRVTTGH